MLGFSTWRKWQIFLQTGHTKPLCAIHIIFKKSFSEVENTFLHNLN